MSKDSKRIPERRKTRNYQRIIADVSQILRRDSPMHLRLKISANVRWLFGEYSAISRWSSRNIRRALLPTKHHQWFRKIFNASIENFGHREMLPHEYHEFRLFAESSVIPPEHRLMLVNFHRECISDAKKAQWDRAMMISRISTIFLSQIHDPTTSKIYPPSPRLFLLYREQLHGGPTLVPYIVSACWERVVSFQSCHVPCTENINCCCDKRNVDQG